MLTLVLHWLCDADVSMSRPCGIYEALTPLYSITMKYMTRESELHCQTAEPSSTEFACGTANVLTLWGLTICMNGISVFGLICWDIYSTLWLSMVFVYQMKHCPSEGHTVQRQRSQFLFCLWQGK